ncbi:MAG TPA: ABC transporter ATP-binding protein [Ilumatobacteraceae bacterium]|nr:ABC transporter ATP-binding protein [Ilumatobacteraceae bacterium]
MTATLTHPFNPPTSAEASTSTAAARAVGATKRYGSGDATVTALNDVTVDFHAHQFTAIMGPSGSGKSTLMHLVAGLDTLTSGSVYIGDTDLSGLDDRHLTLLRRDKIGFIFQAYNLVPTLSALENIVLPTTLAGRKPDKQWLDTVVDTVGLGNRLRHRPSELSGGQQQRVAVARALASRPAIIFGDEPTGNLDSRTGAEILSFMRSAVRDLGQTIVMVTHDPAAASYAERVIFLADGSIVDEMHAPTADRVLDRMKHFGE